MNENNGSNQERQNRMNILARFRVEDLEAALAGWPDRPDYKILRGPETGLTMVQARAGGTGRRFNLGEMTITRCSVQTGDGYIGHAYLAGRSFRRAELAALVDALAQDPAKTAQVQSEILVPLQKKSLETQKAAAEKTAATKVDFFTMVRGDD